MALLLPSVSLATLLHPLPEQVLGVFLRVLRDVPSALAAPFVLKQLPPSVLASADVDDVKNVLFKLKAACTPDGHPGPSLKALQAACPDSPTIYIGESRTHCHDIKCRRPLSKVGGVAMVSSSWVFHRSS